MFIAIAFDVAINVFRVLFLSKRAFGLQYSPYVVCERRSSSAVV